jgi:NAD(P)-dependent dehydrogenase (short-subunit alcohol dehydrogenase family)
MICENLTAIVAGGVGGIGRAVVRKLLEEGAMVVAADAGKTDLDDCLSLCRDFKDSLVGVRTDVSSAKDVRRLVAKTVDRFKTVDVLVDAAGIQGPIGPVAENDPEAWMAAVRINLFGSFLLARAVLPVMMEKKSGSIVLFSGGGATGPRPRFSAYACSKAAVVRFAETLAEEVSPFGIRVNAVAPGAVNTRMLEEVLSAGKDSVGQEYHQALKRKSEGGTPPELAAGLVAFLASDQSAGLSGRLIAAPWDPWKSWAQSGVPELSKAMYTLRRVDGRDIVEK